MAKAAKKKPLRRRPSVKPRTPAPKDKTLIADTVVNQTEMAAILGITTRWLRVLVNDGAVPSPGRGKFLVGQVVQAYLTFKTEGVEKATGTSTTLDRVREERAEEIRLNRMRKDRQLISVEEAMGTIDEIVGLFVSSLTGLPAQITGVPRERQRLNDIFDTERQRLADRFAEKAQTLRTGREASDTEAEDDAD